MALALGDSVPLAAWLVFAVALALALSAKYVLEPIFHAINDALGWVPFVGGWIERATEKVIHWLNVAIVYSRDAMAWLWHLFLWSVRETVTVTEEAFGYAEGSLVALVKSAIPGALSNLWQDVLSLTIALGKRIDAAVQLSWDNLTRAEKYADGAAAGALKTAETYVDATAATITRYVDRKVSDAVNSVESDLAAGLTAAIVTAEAYTDAARKAIEGELSKAVAGVESDLGAAVSTLNAAIGTVASRLTATATALEGDISAAEASGQAALAAAASSLLGDIATAKQQAETAASALVTSTAAGLEAAIGSAENAASSALSSAESTLSGAISTVSAVEADALRAAVGELDSAIAGVRGEADAIASSIAAAGAAGVAELEQIYGLGYDQLRTLVDKLDLSNIVGWAAAIVLIRGLVETLAAEAGLGSSECRALNKQICGVSSGAWGDLLGLLGDFVLIADPCAIVPLLEEGFSLVGAPLVETLTAVEAGLCSATSSPPPAIPVPELMLPSAGELELQLAA